MDERTELPSGPGPDTSLAPAHTTPRVIPLPSTAAASADALAKIAGAPLDAAAFAALHAENAAMLDVSPAGLMPGLARNLVVMQALATKLVSDAMSTRNEGARAAFLRSAFAASREVREIVALMRDLKAEARGEDQRTVGAG